LFLKYGRSSILSKGEPPIASSKGRVELDRLAKELLGDSDIFRA